MSRTSQIAAGLLAAVTLVPVLASAQGRAFSLGKHADVELATSTRIGPVMLQPGRYRFQYHEHDGRHDLVVRARDQKPRAGGDPAVGSGTEVARVGCILVPLGQQIRETALVVKTDPDGTPRIIEIRIRGEAAGHVVAREPTG